MSTYYENNKDKVKQYRRDWRKKNPKKRQEQKRRERYKSLYGITIQDYNRMFEEQNGCCAICGRHQSEFKNRLAVDHSHFTGKVRGLLCPYCNNQIGRIETSEYYKKCIAYLDKSRL